MVQQVFWTLLVRVLLVAAGFISSVITARMLGPEGRGVFFYWTTIAGVVIQFGNLGLHSSNTYFLAKEKAPLSTLASNSLAVSSIMGFILGGILAVVVWYREGYIFEVLPLLLPTILLVPVGLYFLLGTNLLVALDRIGEYNSFELVNRYVGLAALVLAAYVWNVPQSLITAIALTSLGVCILLYWRLQVLGGKGAVSLSVFKKGIGYAFRIYLVSLFGFLVLRVSTVILEIYVDPAVLGNWSIAVQLLDVINMVPATIALVLLPKLMRSDDAYQMMRAQLLWVMVLLLGVCVLAMICGQFFIEWVYGEAFLEAYSLLKWGLPGAVGLGLISIISQYLCVAGVPVTSIFLWAGAFVVEIILALLWIPEYGGEGAMAALSFTYILLVFFMYSIAIRAHRKVVSEVD